MAHNHYKSPGGEDQSFLAEAGLLESYGHDVSRYTLHNDAVNAQGVVQTALQTVWSAPVARQIAGLVHERQIEVAHFQNTFPLISPSAYYAAHNSGAAVVQSLRNYRIACSNGMLYRDGKICESCVGQFAPLSGIVHKCYRGSTLGSAVVAGMVGVHKILGTYKKEVDLFIAISEFVKNKYIEIGFDADQIVVKPNVVAPDPGPGTGQGGYALYVGRLSEEKGLRTLLEAWQKGSPSIPLRIIGEGILQSEVEKAAEATNIEYLGQRSLQETYSLMGEAEMLIVPSEWHEPFGRVVIEAFAKGTPVIAAAMGGLTELIEDGLTGYLFEAGNKDALIDKIRLLKGDEELSTGIRNACRQIYLEKYASERNHEMLVSIYQSAVAKKSKAKNVRG